MSAINSLDTLGRWLADTPVAVFIQESEWAFQALETVHVIAVAIVVGTISIVDLRLLGFASTDRPVTDVMKDCLKWTWAAFGMAVASGGLMFVSNASKYLGATPFRMKVLFLLLAAINMLVFELITARDIASWNDDRESPRPGRIAAAFSLLLWVGIVAFGRWIGFVINPR